MKFGPAATVRMSAAVLAFIATSPAFAQLEKITTTMTVIQAALLAIAVICLTIALLWAGYKMIFSHARWTDVSNIVIGGIIIGASGTIAAWLAGGA